MRTKVKGAFLALLVCLLVWGCASTRPKIPMESDSSQPGTAVARGGVSVKLFGKPVAAGQSVPATRLVDSISLKDVDLAQEKGAVLFLSIVPSLDTPVCEEQTHYLGKEGDKLPKEVRRITISRDTPFAQKRFAKEAKLTDIQYLSDYKDGRFGRSTGLLMEGSMLLARSIMIVDKKGIVRYIQVVPEITHLPDMEKAFQKATELVKEP